MLLYELAQTEDDSGRTMLLCNSIRHAEVRVPQAGEPTVKADMGCTCNGGAKTRIIVSLWLEKILEQVPFKGLPKSFID